MVRRAERWLKRQGERFPRWEGLESGSQATAFPFVVAESEMNKRLPWSMDPFLATAFSFAAAVFEAGKRCPRRQSQ